MATAHPKQKQICAFCKKWTGDANLVPKNKHIGLEYKQGVYGKCMANGSNQPSTGGTGCRDYAPSARVEAFL